jgi:hypothetical protein
MLEHRSTATKPGDPMAASSFKGGCGCGAVRYLLTTKPTDAGYCHCRFCQKNIGAPVVAWLQVPITAIRYTAGQPRVCISREENAERRFCPNCGTHTDYRAYDEPATVYVLTPTLDRPKLVPPAYHIFFKQHIAWFNTIDKLPRYAKEPPESAG